MKNLLELSRDTETLAESLTAETSHKKISDAITARFNELQLDDADWPVFNSLFKENAQRLVEKNTRNAMLVSRLTETEKLKRKAAEAKSTEAKPA